MAIKGYSAFPRAQALLNLTIRLCSVKNCKFVRGGLAGAVEYNDCFSTKHSLYSTAPADQASERMELNKSSQKKFKGKKKRKKTTERKLKNEEKQRRKKDRQKGEKKENGSKEEMKKIKGKTER